MSSFWECEGCVLWSIGGFFYCVALEHIKIACDPRRERWR